MWNRPIPSETNNSVRSWIRTEASKDAEPDRLVPRNRAGYSAAGSQKEQAMMLAWMSERRMDLFSCLMKFDLLEFHVPKSEITQGSKYFTGSISRPFFPSVQRELR